MKKTITVRLSSGLNKAFKEFCWKNKIVPSKATRMALVDFMQRYSRGKVKKVAKEISIMEEKSLLDMSIKFNMKHATFKKNMDFNIYLAIHNTTNRKPVINLIDNAVRISRLFKDKDLIAHYKDMLAKVRDIKQYSFIKDEADRVVFENAAKVKMARFQNKDFN